MKFFTLRHPGFSSEGTSEISRLRSGWLPAKHNFQIPQGRKECLDSAVPSGRNSIRTVVQPLRSWLISGCRFATQSVLVAAILFFARGAFAAMTNGLSNAEIAGLHLVQQILELSPTENVANTGVLKIRDGKGKRTEIPVTIKTVVTLTNWWSDYIVTYTNLTTNHANEASFGLRVIHADNKPNEYKDYRGEGYVLSADLPDHTLLARSSGGVVPEGFLISLPFAGSDFSFGDLGLEFFHWPQQKVLRKEFRRSCGCSVLESVNPNPTTNGYSRVVTWIDNESLGIVQAEAYDSKNKLLKEFYPKDIKKVNGQWQVQTLDISNVQTGSRTRLEFDLNP